MFMKICFWDGINADQIKVEISDGNKIALLETYTAGRDFSNSNPNLPTAGDIMRDLVETYRIENDQIEYSGFNVFMGKPFSDKYLEKRINDLIEEV